MRRRRPILTGRIPEPTDIPSTLDISKMLGIAIGHFAAEVCAKPPMAKYDRPRYCAGQGDIRIPHLRGFFQTRNTICHNPFKP